MGPPGKRRGADGHHPTDAATTLTSAHQEADTADGTARGGVGESVTVDQLLADMVGQETAGGCESCAAEQVVHQEAEGIFRLEIRHDNECPVLRHHTVVAPLRVQLAEIQRQQRFWRDVDLERLAQREDFADVLETMPEAGADAVLAARAWRAGVLAQLEVIGAALGERLDAEAGRVPG